MPDNTPSLILPYPLPADPPDGASQIQALAEQLDTIVPLIQSGTETLTTDGNNFVTFALTFPRQFAATPTVVSVSDNTLWTTQARTVTTAGCQLGIRQIELQPDTGTPILVHWIAVGVGS